VRFTWAADPSAVAYHAYRGVTKGVWPPAPTWPELAGPLLVAAELVSPEPFRLYRVTGVSCSGAEGP